jgi:hypothetical protein
MAIVVFMGFGDVRIVGFGAVAPELELPCCPWLRNMRPDSERTRRQSISRLGLALPWLLDFSDLFFLIVVNEE